MIIKSKNQPTLIIRDQNYNFEFSFEVSKQNKKYYSEIICITNCANENHLYEWLYWHINIIKIEHLVLIDNTPDGKLETIAKKFNVSYKNITGILSQCDIYNNYVNNSEAEWVLLEWVAISFSNACMHAKSLQSCPTLCDPMDSSPPGSSVHGIFQARVLEWGAIAMRTRHVE